MAADAGGGLVIDAEVYIHDLIEQSMTATAPPSDLWVAPDIDVDTLEELPALTWNLSGDSSTANGPGLWNYVLNVSIFGDGMDQAKQFAKYVDAMVQSWDVDPLATAIEVDGSDVACAGVDDVQLPARQATADIGGRLVVQYVGIYALALRG
jgi:hypothetical protein